MTTITTEKTILTAASELYAAFEQGKRDNGVAFWRLKSGSPDWMQDIIMAAHDDMMPDDYCYRFIYDFLYRVAYYYDPKADELSGDIDQLKELAFQFADDDTDVYTHDLCLWLASNNSRTGFVDAAIDEGLSDNGNGICGMIAAGQAMERREVYDRLIAALADYVS